MTDVPPRNELSPAGYWDTVWSGRIRLRLPSGYIVATRNLQRLLRTYVRAGDRFLEVGCAPGKMLAWVAADLKADVCGIDSSTTGLFTTRQLFEALGLPGDLRCEDLANTTLAPGSFDVVYSSGLIEHFADPAVVVRQHLQLVKPGGVAVMTVPNYSGVYGTLQRHFDAQLLSIHNLDVMACDALRRLVPRDAGYDTRVYPAGRLSPWMLTMAARWPRSVALAVSHAVNAVALLQPVDIPALCPMLVLEVCRH